MLRDPVTHQPLPNARYRLFLPGQVIAGLPVKPGQRDSVIFGTTDAAGRTVRIRLPTSHPQKQWVFNPIIGEGDLGESFRLVGPSGDTPLGSFPYVLDVEHEYLACGYSDANGYTYYAQSRTRRNVNLHTGMLGGSAAHCGNRSSPSCCRWRSRNATPAAWLPCSTSARFPTTA
ncbi:hypothetical protein [Burkholderia anthina]|uniref:hypothetical protein n=1 Tax=Burkholderia anthina TaxID=179879 RepID=UPI001FB5F2BD|nr:hypothetical protein [Burkholderia anthina]